MSCVGACVGAASETEFDGCGHEGEILDIHSAAHSMHALRANVVYLSHDIGLSSLSMYINDDDPAAHASARRRSMYGPACMYASVFLHGPTHAYSPTFDK